MHYVVLAIVEMSQPAMQLFYDIVRAVWYFAWGNLNTRWMVTFPHLYRMPLAKCRDTLRLFSVLILCLIIVHYRIFGISANARIAYFRNGHWWALVDVFVNEICYRYSVLVEININNRNTLMALKMRPVFIFIYYLYENKWAWLLILLI